MTERKKKEEKKKEDTRRTLEGSVPHAPRDGDAVSDWLVRLQGLVQRERVQNDRVMERAHETVHLQRENNVEQVKQEHNTKLFTCSEKTMREREREREREQ